MKADTCSTVQVMADPIKYDDSGIPKRYVRFIFVDGMLSDLFVLVSRDDNVGKIIVHDLNDESSMYEWWYNHRTGTYFECNDHYNGAYPMFQS